MPRWSIVVHGGAKPISAALADAHRQGCLQAVKAGQRVLEDGGSAVEAALQAVLALENDPTFNAGYGSVLNASGETELDAAIMDGATLDVGSVCALCGVRNPIEAAHAMLRDQPVILVGDGAYRYAEEKGLTLCDPAWHIAPKTAEPCDTVGCVVMDRNGDLAAASSTGGLTGVRPGRVGDAPIPGCGLYAENGVGAVTFSGDGESILRLALAARAIAELPSLGPRLTAGAAIKRMPRVGGEAGCILIDHEGRPAVAHNSPHFAVGLATSDEPARAAIHYSELEHD